MVPPPAAGPGRWPGKDPLPHRNFGFGGKVSLYLQVCVHPELRGKLTSPSEHVLVRVQLPVFSPAYPPSPVIPVAVAEGEDTSVAAVPFSATIAAVPGHPPVRRLLRTPTMKSTQARRSPLSSLLKWGQRLLWARPVVANAPGVCRRPSIPALPSGEPAATAPPPFARRLPHVKYAIEMRNVSKRYLTAAGTEVVAVDHVTLEILDGEFFSLLGPSGCGKTTSLRMIAGFELPTAGEIYIHGRPMDAIPPNKRPVNTVFQNYALFPHMTIGQNVAFGLEMERLPKAEITRRVGEALEMVRLTGYENRKPHQLSGGQQQRVALARALVKRPEVLLLDEPLGALDLKLRKEMQLELKKLQREVGITFVYVTHDQEEALTMSDRIAVMNGGRVLQVGTAAEIYERPRNRFVADFIGETNFLAGTVVATTAEEQRYLVQLAGGAVLAATSEHPLHPGQQVIVAIRPEKMHLLNGSQRSFDHADTWVYIPGRVQEIVYIGTDTHYDVRLEGGPVVRVREQNRDAFAPKLGLIGESVNVSFAAAAARILVD
jgi:spermidine/putrescine transport system ATP-binding protein